MAQEEMVTRVLKRGNMNETIRDSKGVRIGSKKIPIGGKVTLSAANAKIFAHCFEGNKPVEKSPTVDQVIEEAKMVIGKCEDEISLLGGKVEALESAAVAGGDALAAKDAQIAELQAAAKKVEKAAK